jgi:5'-nucleotidase
LNVFVEEIDFRTEERVVKGPMKRSYLLVVLCLGLVSCTQKQRKFSESQLPAPIQASAQPTPAPNTVEVKSCASKKLTILGTNDIHGNFDGKFLYLNQGDSTAKKVGGLSLFAGIVKSAREKADDCNGVIVLDGGDQFQGTLVSNFNEGLLMGQVMKEVGYDAIVPGNHDYDFGPIGWENDSLQHAEETRLNALERFSVRTRRELSAPNPNDSPDRVSPKDPKATIIQFKEVSNIPLLSANTYQLNSIKDKDGNKVNVGTIGCRPLPGEKPIDWTQAERPSFLRDTLIKETGGLKVAIVGLDIAITPSVTTKANVLDLCFRDPAEEFLAQSKELRKVADVIVVVAHFGDATKESANLVREASKDGTDKVVDDLSISGFLDRVLTNPGCLNGECIDALVGGHTHAVNQIKISGVPAIQSGSNAQRFGRIELEFDPQKKKVDRSKTKIFAGKYMVQDVCDKGTESFCKVNTQQQAVYDGSVLAPSIEVRDLVEKEKSKVAPLAERVLGNVKKEMGPNRTEESALANSLSDALVEIGKPSGVTVGFLNSGGIRSALKAGTITYSAFYEVLPFNNRAVIIPNFRVSDLITVVKKSIMTCGKFGAMNFSGIRVQFRKDCTGSNQSQEDLNAKLILVETLAGEILYDDSLPPDAKIPNNREMKVITLDFLADGGSGYGEGFRPEHQKNVIPRPFREKFVELWSEHPFDWDNKRDGRMKNLNN